MATTLRLGVLALISALAVAATATIMPLPFTRELILVSPCLTGIDVELLQHLLSRSPSTPPGLNVTRCYDAATAAATALFQTSLGLPATGTLDNATATFALLNLERDNFKDDDTPPATLGYKYKIRVNVYQNRSREGDAFLIAGNGTVLFSYRIRAHGANVPGTDPSWPNFSDCCYGGTQFGRNGNTPTGLMLANLESPEDDPKSYGPYPINRAISGLKGNALFSVPAMRSGILQHTGAWANYSKWQPPAPMPNSLGQRFHQSSLLTCAFLFLFMWWTS